MGGEEKNRLKGVTELSGDTSTQGPHSALRHCTAYSSFRAAQNVWLLPIFSGIHPSGCLPAGSAALSLQVGTALQGVTTLLWVWGQLSYLCHYNHLFLLSLSSRKAKAYKQKNKYTQKTPTKASTNCLFSQLSSVGHPLLIGYLGSQVIWKHILLWCILIKLQRVHWWNDAKILIVVNSSGMNWPQTRLNSSWGFYETFFKRNSRRGGNNKTERVYVTFWVSACCSVSVMCLGLLYENFALLLNSIFNEAQRIKWTDLELYCFLNSWLLLEHGK